MGPISLMERPGSSAFDIEFVTLPDGTGQQRDLAVVADFTGGVEIFDITDLLYGSSAGRTPIATWTVPPSVLEGIPPNVYDVEIDLPTPGAAVANIYVASSRGGVYVLDINLTLPNIITQNPQRIKTPGEAHSIEIRSSSAGKLMLVGDLSAGYRFYRIGN